MVCLSQKQVARRLSELKCQPVSCTFAVWLTLTVFLMSFIKSFFFFFIFQQSNTSYQIVFFFLAGKVSDRGMQIWIHLTLFGRDLKLIWLLWRFYSLQSNSKTPSTSPSIFFLLVIEKERCSVLINSSSLIFSVSWCMSSGQLKYLWSTPADVPRGAIWWTLT